MFLTSHLYCILMERNIGTRPATGTYEGGCGHVNREVGVATSIDRHLQLGGCGHMYM